MVTTSPMLRTKLLPCATATGLLCLQNTEGAGDPFKLTAWITEDLGIDIAHVCIYHSLENIFQEQVTQKWSRQISPKHVLYDLLAIQSASGGTFGMWSKSYWKIAPRLPESLMGFSEFSLQVTLPSRQLISSSMKGTGQDNKWTTDIVIHGLLQELQVFLGQNERKGVWVSSQNCPPRTRLTRITHSYYKHSSHSMSRTGPLLGI